MTFLLGILLKLGVPQRFAGVAAWGVIALGAVVALGFAYWRITDSAYDRGVAAEKARWEDAQRKAAAKAAADTAQLQSALSEIDTGITIDMEALSNVRTVYRDRTRTVAVDVYRDRDCALPGGLLEQVNAAAQGYAAAASGNH